MHHRYSRDRDSRGQAAQPKSAWGSGGGTARAGSPEPASIGLSGPGAGPHAAAPALGAALGSEGGADLRQDEVILQLETELIELRNVCAWKDQRIAELSRTDAPATRLKKDIRLLVAELHQSRKELSVTRLELQETRSQVEALRNTGSSSSVSALSADHGISLREQVAVLMEENRQLRSTMEEWKSSQPPPPPRQAQEGAGVGAGIAIGRDGSPINANAVGIDGGASTHLQALQPQHAPESALRGSELQATSVEVSASAAATGGAGHEWGKGWQMGVKELPRTTSKGGHDVRGETRQIVYSSANLQHAATIGPTLLEGVGPVEGVQAVATVLLQRIQSSVRSAHWRAGRQMPGQGAGGADVPTFVP